jgi:hypothetical protein
MDWKEQFDEEFNWASFTWNGDNATGIRFAKNKKMKVKRFISTEIIEKLIADIKYQDFWNIPMEEFDNKVQQLRDKWQ